MSESGPKPATMGRDAGPMRQVSAPVPHYWASNVLGRHVGPPEIAAHLTWEIVSEIAELSRAEMAVPKRHAPGPA